MKYLNIYAQKTILMVENLIIQLAFTGSDFFSPIVVIKLSTKSILMKVFFDTFIFIGLFSL